MEGNAYKYDATGLFFLMNWHKRQNNLVEETSSDGVKKVWKPVFCSSEVFSTQVFHLKLVDDPKLNVA